MKNNINNRFRDIYTYINHDTLRACSYEHPELLIEIINSPDFSPTIVNEELDALCDIVNPKYFELIMSFINHVNPRIQITAYWGIRFYYDEYKGEYEWIPDFLKKELTKNLHPDTREALIKIQKNISKETY